MRSSTFYSLLFAVLTFGSGLVQASPLPESSLVLTRDLSSSVVRRSSGSQGQGGNSQGNDNDDTQSGPTQHTDGCGQRAGRSCN